MVCMYLEWHSKSRPIFLYSNGNHSSIEIIFPAFKWCLVFKWSKQSIVYNTICILGCPLEVHWLLVPRDRSSNPGGGEQFSSFWVLLYRSSKVKKLSLPWFDKCSRMQLSDKPYHKDLSKTLTHDKRRAMNPHYYILILLVLL